VLVVLRRKVEVRLPRHDYSFGLDTAQRFLKVSVVFGVGTNVPVLPCPRHRQEIIRIFLEEETFPVRDKKVFEPAVADVPVSLFPVERLRETPSSVDAPHWKVCWAPIDQPVT